MIRTWSVWLLDWWRSLSGKDRAPIVLEVVAILVVGAYTTVAALQWCEMRKATAATKESADTAVATLHQSQRPWIAPDAGIQVVGAIHNNPSKIKFLFTLKNTGNSVGLGVESGLWLSDDLNQILDSKSCEKMVATEREAIALAHRANRRGKVAGGGGGGATPETGNVLFPNATLISEIGAQQEGAPKEPREWVYALLCIVYFDQFEIVHLTKLTYCFGPRPIPSFPISGPASGVPKFCQQGNYAN